MHVTLTRTLHRQAWTAVQVFRNGYACTDTFQLPLFHGRPPASVIQRLSRTPCLDCLNASVRDRTVSMFVMYAMYTFIFRHFSGLIHCLFYSKQPPFGDWHRSLCIVCVHVLGTFQVTVGLRRGFAVCNYKREIKVKLNSKTYFNSNLGHC